MKILSKLGRQENIIGLIKGIIYAALILLQVLYSKLNPTHILLISYKFIN